MMIDGTAKKALLALTILLCFSLSNATSATFAFRPKKDDVRTRSEKRPKKLFWGPSSKGFQMAVWVSPVRPIVFGIIRNASDRSIHYCDYLLGTSVVVYARKSPLSEWVKIPELPVKDPISIGSLPCGSRDTLYPGEEMNASPTAFTRNRIKGKHTFEVGLAAYDLPTDWLGIVDCKIVQTIFGGGDFAARHPDGYSGEIESPSFTVKLPIDRSDISE